MEGEWWKDPQWLSVIGAMLLPLSWLYWFLVYRPRLSAEIRWIQPVVTPPKGGDLKCEVVVKNFGRRGAIVEKVIGLALDDDGEKKWLSHKANSPSRFLTKDIAAEKGVVVFEAFFYAPNAELLATLEVQVIYRYGKWSVQKIKAQKNFVLGIMLAQQPWPQRWVKQWAKRFRRRFFPPHS